MHQVHICARCGMPDVREVVRRKYKTEDGDIWGGAYKEVVDLCCTDCGWVQWGEVS